MRVQSVKKLEKQARRYSDTHEIVMPKEWENEYNSLTFRARELKKEFAAIQEECPLKNGEDCNCAKHPNFERLNSELEPISARLDTMNYEKGRLQQSLYKRELIRLLKMRLDKLNYLTTME